MECKWIKLGEKGTPYIPEGYLEYVQKWTFTDTRKVFMGWNGVSKKIVHNAPIKVWQRSVPRGHFPVVPTPLGIFPPLTVCSRRWIFAWWFVNLGRVNPNYSIHWSDFDVAWLIGWTVAKYRAYTLESSLFLVNFKISVLVKNKTLQGPLSIQVDLNQGINEGLILLRLMKQLMKNESKIHDANFLISPTTHLFPLVGQSGSRG